MRRPFSSSFRARRLFGLPLGALSGVLLTHYHSDHIADLGEVLLWSWIQAGGRRASPLPVYGPPGVAEVVGGFARAYALDAGYRTAHHGADRLPPGGARARAIPIKLPPSDEPSGKPSDGDGDDDGETAGGTAVVVDEGGLRITAFRVHHEPASPAYGYRVDYRGRSAVVSGDTVRCARQHVFAEPLPCQRLQVP